MPNDQDPPEEDYRLLDRDQRAMAKGWGIQAVLYLGVFLLLLWLGSVIVDHFYL